jgi:hypothetical protein
MEDRLIWSMLLRVEKVVQVVEWEELLPQALVAQAQEL